MPILYISNGKEPDVVLEALKLYLVAQQDPQKSLACAKVLARAIKCIELQAPNKKSADE